MNKHNAVEQQLGWPSNATWRDLTTRSTHAPDPSEAGPGGTWSWRAVSRRPPFPPVARTLSPLPRPWVSRTPGGRKHDRNHGLVREGRHGSLCLRAGVIDYLGSL